MLNEAVFGAKMSYILVLLMNLLELITLTLTSVMVFYYLRVCVVVVTSCNRTFFAHSVKISKYEVYYVGRVDMY